MKGVQRFYPKLWLNLTWPVSLRPWKCISHDCLYIDISMNMRPINARMTFNHNGIKTMSLFIRFNSSHALFTWISQQQQHKYVLPFNRLLTLCGVCSNGKWKRSSSAIGLEIEFNSFMMALLRYSVWNVFVGVNNVALERCSVICFYVLYLFTLSEVVYHNFKYIVIAMRIK